MFESIFDLIIRSRSDHNRMKPRLPGTSQGSKPRNNALCLFVVWKLYTCRFATATNRAFLNPTRFPYASLHKSFKFCGAKLAAVRQIKLFRRKSLCAPGFQVFEELVTERWLVSVAELSRSDRGMAKTRKSK